MEWLKSWLGSTYAAETTRQAVAQRAAPLPALVMRADATMPIVDWDAMDAHAPGTDQPEELDAYWTAIARAWLEALGQALDKSFHVTESDHFLLLSPLGPRPAKVVLEFVEKTRKRVLFVLNGIADEVGVGKVCVLILNDRDRYYQYVSNYYPKEGEFSLSGGMFLQHGYGHFVFVADDMLMMEPTIAHELTHCLLQHLPLPCWLNEGMAVNTERRLCPPPGRPLYTPEEMHEKHLAFWNEQTIQEFWSGKSWLRQDDGNMLSYDLATHFVSMAAQNFDAFRKLRTPRSGKTLATHRLANNSATPSRISPKPCLAKVPGSQIPKRGRTESRKGSSVPRKCGPNPNCYSSGVGGVGERSGCCRGAATNAAAGFCTMSR